MKHSFANSHRSGSTFRNPYVFSCRTKLLKLLCLKCSGSKSRANSGGFHTTKVRPFEPHDTMSSVELSFTSSYVCAAAEGSGEHE